MSKAEDRSETPLWTAKENSLQMRGSSRNLQGTIQSNTLTARVPEREDSWKNNGREYSRYNSKKCVCVCVHTHAHTCVHMYSHMQEWRSRWRSEVSVPWSWSYSCELPDRSARIWTIQQSMSLTSETSLRHPKWLWKSKPVIIYTSGKFGGCIGTASKETEHASLSTQQNGEGRKTNRESSQLLKRPGEMAQWMRACGRVWREERGVNYIIVVSENKKCIVFKKWVLSLAVFAVATGDRPY